MHKVKEAFDHIIDKVLILIETLIAIISVVVLVGLLAVALIHMFQNPTAFFGTEDAVTEYLHHMLTIVVGLEFVKLLMHLTPANILEVLIMAISRGIIVNHGSAVDNLLSILCIVALFAAKRYLIPRAELHKGMDEEIPDSHFHRGSRKHKHKSEHHSEPAQHQH